MRIAILSGGDGWHVRDLHRAAADLGHDAISLDFRTLHSNSLAGYEAIIVRTMPAGSLEQIIFRMDLLHDAAAKGTIVLNPPRALETCVDKYLTDVRLQAAGLPSPKTIVCQTAEDAMRAFESLGRDVVVKPIFGSEGRGMVRITDAEIAWRTFHALATTQSVLYLQEFIHHPGWDIRAFVINNNIIAAIRRSHPTDWRTNVARGGEATQHNSTEMESTLALNAAKATGAQVAGIDLIYDNSQVLRILEVNAVPGWKALASTCNIDIAIHIVQAVGPMR